MSRTATQRKASERERMRAQGFVIFTYWVHSDDRARLARYAERLRKRRA